MYHKVGRKMDRRMAVRVVRSSMIMEIVTSRCSICDKDLHGDLGLAPDQFDKTVLHVMSHTDKERKAAGVKFKGRPNADERWNGMRC